MRWPTRGTVLRDVMAAAPWTLPSFASALTGLSPCLHGAVLPGDVRNMDTQPPRRLDPGAVTLARHLGGRGYRTAAFYANQFFAFGLAESFGEHAYVNLPAADVLAVALDWIRRHADRPFFCFVLLNDPHEPTTPAAADLAAFLPGALADGVPPPGPDDLRALASWGDRTQPGRHLGLARWPLSDVTRQQRRLKLAVYDATIRGVDRAIGAAADRLARWGLDRNTITTVFSDHGEEFLDHAAEAHSWSHDPREVRARGPRPHAVPGTAPRALAELGTWRAARPGLGPTRCRSATSPPRTPTGSACRWRCRRGPARGWWAARSPRICARAAGTRPPPSAGSSPRPWPSDPTSSRSAAAAGS